MDKTAYIDIDVFPDVKMTKEQAVKIIEEAAEAYEHAAWLSKYDSFNWSARLFVAHKNRYFLEMVDVIQALVNFASTLCKDEGELQARIAQARNDVYRKNMRRGHYDEQ